MLGSPILVARALMCFSNVCSKVFERRVYTRICFGARPKQFSRSAWICRPWSTKERRHKSAVTLGMHAGRFCIRDSIVLAFLHVPVVKKQVATDLGLGASSWGKVWFPPKHIVLDANCAQHVLQSLQEGKKRRRRGFLLAVSCSPFLSLFLFPFLCDVFFLPLSPHVCWCRCVCMCAES